LQLNFEINSNGATNNVEAWHVTESFINSIINTASQSHIQVANNSTDEMKAQASMVDELFEIDREGFIKQRFIELFKEDSQGLKANV
jgi:hypothetical protein